MSLVPIESLANGTLFFSQPVPSGAPLLTPAAAVVCQVFLHNTSTPYAVKVDEFSGVNAPLPLVTDENGAIPGWVDVEDFPLDISASLAAGTKTFVLGQPGVTGLSLVAGDARYIHQDGTGFPSAIALKNTANVGFNGGGSPKFSLPPGKATVFTDAAGNLIVGPNYLLDTTNTTLATNVADLAYLQANPRVLLRNITGREVGDPPDITLGMLGGGYPYGGGIGNSAASTSSSIVVTNSANATELTYFVAGQVLIGDINAGIPDNTHILSVGTISGNTVTLTLDNVVNIAANAVVHSIARTQDYLAVDAGGIIGELRCEPAAAPNGGTAATGGAAFHQISASDSYVLAELPRIVTPNPNHTSLAQGTRRLFRTTKKGRGDTDIGLILSENQNLQVGQGAANQADNGNVLQLRNYDGVDEIHQLTTKTTPTGGSPTFKLTFYPDPVPNGYPTPIQTGSIAYPGTIANVKAAFAALRTGSQSEFCVFTNGSAAVTILNPTGIVPVAGETVTDPGHGTANIPAGTTVLASPAPTATSFTMSANATNNSGVNGIALTISNWTYGLENITFTGGPLPTPLNIDFSGPYFGNHHYSTMAVDSTGLGSGVVVCTATQTGQPPSGDPVDIRDSSGANLFHITRAGVATGSGVMTFTSGSHSARLAVASPPLNQVWQETSTGLHYIGTGSVWNILKSDGVIRKPTDQTLTGGSANVLQSDADLHFPIEPNEAWFVEWILLTNAQSVNSDWQVGFTFPTGCTADWGYYGKSSDAAGGEFVGMINTTATLNSTRTISGTASFASMNGRQFTHIAGTFVNAANSGVLTLQWAQNTLQSGETNTVLTNSFMRLRRLV